MPLLRNLCVVVRNLLVSAFADQFHVREIVRRMTIPPRASSSALTLHKIDIRKE
ncbi:hypothetical protein AOG2_31820 [Geobacter sp. AOG2]|nr:hypothetical protein AOG2_31820 [Geobacter sp. AOG2]